MPKKSNKKRADGRISVQVYLGRFDGKRKYKTVYGATQKEADAKADEVRSKISKGLSVDSSDTFSRWAEFFLKMKKGTVTDARYDLIKSRVDVWSKQLGKARISAIRTVELQSILNDIAQKNPTTKKQSAKRTVSAYAQSVSNVFEYAMENRVIDYNPATRLVIPQGLSVSKREALTENERKVIYAFEHRGKPAMMLLMLSGLRRGEASALLWSDINFKNSTISVTKSFDFKAGRLKSPKNGKARIVKIPTVLAEYLSSLPRNSQLVLTNSRGAMMSEASWKWLFKSYIEDANNADFQIEPFSPHNLRHTFCTMMYEAGIDVLVAQQQMGHSSPQITLEIYTHLQEAHKDVDLQKIDLIASKLEQNKNECKSSASQVWLN